MHQARVAGSLFAFVTLALAAACGSRLGTVPAGIESGSASGVAGSSGSSSGSGSTGAVSSGVTASGAGVTGAVTDSGNSATGTSMGSGTASGGSAGSVSGSSSGTGSTGTLASSGTVVPIVDAGPDGGRRPAVPSAGCGKAWAGMTGQWVSQPVGCTAGTQNQGTSACQAIPPGSTVPAVATQGSPENRGWWVFVPAGYDPSRPYTVIYEAIGYGEYNYFRAGMEGLPYSMVDGDNAILVGLDYDTFGLIPGGYDANDPQSNDLLFMPWLMNEIESTLCVDTSREWISDYGDVGNTVAQQFDCAFPARLRGQVLAAGGEPGAPGQGGALPTCHPAPLAAFYVHDINDTDSTFASILPGCSRVLQQNGCSNTKCDPRDATLTTPYPVPAGVSLSKAGTGAACVQFNGCPAEYPVVFCVTTNQAHDNGQDWGVETLFWDFIDGDTVSCQPGQIQDGPTCVTSCASPKIACGGYCVNDQVDATRCGACGNVCSAAQTCQAGVCACPAGELACGTTCVKSGNCACADPGLACNGFCINPMTDTHNCGACGTVCPAGASACVNGICMAN